MNCIKFKDCKNAIYPHKCKSCGTGMINFENKENITVRITNKELSAVNANKSMQFDCPNCNYNQITKAWNYIHNYCPHCGVKLIWNLSE